MISLFGDSTLGQLGNNVVNARLKNSNLGGALDAYNYFNQSNGQPQPGEPTDGVRPAQFPLDNPNDPSAVDSSDPNTIQNAQKLAYGSMPQPMIAQQPAPPTDDTRVKNGQDSGIWGVIKMVASIV